MDKNSATEKENLLRLKRQTCDFTMDPEKADDYEIDIGVELQFNCLDSQNESVGRFWVITADWRDKKFSIIGKDVTGNKRKYVKSYCNVDIYINKWRKACSYQTKLGGPDCSQFKFENFCCWSDIVLTHSPVLSVLINITVGIEDDMIDGIVPLELDDFMNSTFLSDCVIKTEEKDFPCHKMLLAAKSEYFKTMFSSDLKDTKENVIDWTTVFEADTVYDLIYFIYTGKMPSNIDNTCQKLIHVASLCFLTDLQEICGDRLQTLINRENAVEILLIAIKYRMEKLKEVAVKFIANNDIYIFKTTAWNEANLEITRDMFSAAMDVLRDVMRDVMPEEAPEN